MASKQLTPVQKRVLEALVELYEEQRRMVKSKDVAQKLGKDEGTVRNIIVWLKSMGLVESRTGPAGGYVPTLKAYEILGSSHYALEAGQGIVIVKRDGEESRLTAISLEILGLFATTPARAVVRVVGNIREVSEGSMIRIEGIPRRRLVLEGYVRRRDEHASEILVEVTKMIVIPDELVGNVASRRLITVKEGQRTSEVARVLYTHGIRGAPVTNDKGDVVGFITTTDIAMVVAQGEDLEAPISRYMRRGVFSINERETIVDAMRLMDFHGVGRLLVLNNAGRPIGIITRTDILRYITALS